MITLSNEVTVYEAISMTTYPESQKFYVEKALEVLGIEFDATQTPEELIGLIPFGIQDFVVSHDVSMLPEEYLEFKGYF